MTRSQKRIVAFAFAFVASAVAVSINLATGVEYDYTKLSLDEWFLRIVIAMVNISAIAMAIRVVLRPASSDVIVWVFGLSFFYHLFFWPWATHFDFILFPLGSAVLAGHTAWACMTFTEVMAQAAAIHRRKERADVLEKVDTVWLLDAFNAPESTSRAALVGMVTDLPDGTEHALVRAHRKGVKPGAVTPYLTAEEFTEADADRLATGGAA